MMYFLGMDNTYNFIVIMFALSAAFHMIGHEIMLNRLSDRFRIQAGALEWICFYLSDREQIV